MEVKRSIFYFVYNIAPSMTMLFSIRGMAYFPSTFPFCTLGIQRSMHYYYSYRAMTSFT